MELRQGTRDWEEVGKHFAHTFEFVNEKPTVDAALQVLKAQIFAQIPVIEANSHKSSATIQ